MSSSDYRLKDMADILERCLHDAAVFTRDVPNKSLFERSVPTDDQSWILLGAGLESGEARRYFADTPAQTENAQQSINLPHAGVGSLFLQMRPAARWPDAPPTPDRILAEYAPGKGIPFVEIRRGRLSLTFHSLENRSEIFNLRWEIDPRTAGQPPLEEWLKRTGWHKTIGGNPAHPVSHLHFNSRERLPGRGEWQEEPERDLRLAVGTANPLAFLLSYATWLRRNLTLR